MFIRLRYVIVAVIAMLCSVAAAQPLQNGPLRIIVPLGATTSTDTIARVIADRLSTVPGRGPVVVENITGAAGIVGTQAIRRSAPDGRTIGIVPGTHAVNAALYAKLPFDSIEDFTPVMKIGASPLVIVAPPGGFRSVGEIIEYARSNPDKIFYGSVGIGSSTHLAFELLQSATGIRMVHVPYRAPGQLLNDLVAGRVNIAAVGVATALAQLRAGTLRAIAVTSNEPVTLLPDVPTVENTVPGYEMTPWFGIIGPRGLPERFSNQLESDVGQILRDPQIVTQLRGLGIEPSIVQGDEFWNSVRREISEWERIARAAGIALEPTP